jgi:rubrerythrin
MLSRISFRVEDQMVIGNYILFAGVVTEAESFADGKILTVKSYAERGKAMPTNATVYHTVEINGYRCAICGYVYAGESLPEDFVCPICRAAAKYFEKIEK